MDTTTRPDFSARFELDTHETEANSKARSKGGRDIPKAQIDFGSGWYHEAAIADARGEHADPYQTASSW